MILELWTSVVSVSGIEMITKNNFLVLYLFRDISFFKSEKYDKINIVPETARDSFLRATQNF